MAHGLAYLEEQSGQRAHRQMRLDGGGDGFGVSLELLKRI